MIVLSRYLYLRMQRPKIRRFLAGARQCAEAQRSTLLAKIARNAASDFGRKHGFAGIHSIDAFQRQVPVSGYEYYRPYIDRVKRGDVGAMFGPGTRLLMFALTSGTTSETKYIPITQEFFDEYRRGWFLWGLQTYAQHVDLIRKHTLQLSSNWRQFYTEGGIPCGNISGLAAETGPLISRPVFILPRGIIRISDPAAKMYTALRLALASSRVGMIMTANPSTLVEFAKAANTHRESLIRDLFDGALSDQVDVAPDVRRELGRKIRRRAPQRARELERIVERTGDLAPRDYWPELSVLAVWTGGSVGAYLPRLREYYGETTYRDHGLSASEGRMTLPLADGVSAGVLDYTSHFFEFIPENEHGTTNPTVLLAHELEPEENYFILLTTSSGLYRYDIQDVVRCVGFEGTTPLLEFLNKGAHFSSITGEKLSEYQVVEAAKTSFAELGLSPEVFTVAPRFGDPPRYTLLAEPGQLVERSADLAERMNFHLAQLNCEYQNRLDTARLAPLVVQAAPTGAWNKFRQRRVQRLGGSLEQYKHPALVSDLAFVEQLLETWQRVESQAL
jgi:hypothetical protein